jgi:hypothetical protein
MSYLPAPTHNLSAISLKTIAAAVVALVLARSRVFAQTAIQELAAFSFYHPYLDVLNGSAHTPAARLILEPSAVMQAHAARESGTRSVGALRHRSYRR